MKIKNVLLIIVVVLLASFVLAEDKDYNAIYNELKQDSTHILESLDSPEDVRTSFLHALELLFTCRSPPDQCDANNPCKQEDCLPYPSCFCPTVVRKIKIADKEFLEQCPTDEPIDVVEDEVKIEVHVYDPGPEDPKDPGDPLSLVLGHSIPMNKQYGFKYLGKDGSVYKYEYIMPLKQDHRVGKTEKYHFHLLYGDRGREGVRFPKLPKYWCEVNLKKSGLPIDYAKFVPSQALIGRGLPEIILTPRLGTPDLVYIGTYTFTIGIDDKEWGDVKCDFKSKGELLNTFTLKKLDLNIDYQTRDYTWPFEFKMFADWTGTLNTYTLKCTYYKDGEDLGTREYSFRVIDDLEVVRSRPSLKDTEHHPYLMDESFYKKAFISQTPVTIIFFLKHIRDDVYEAWWVNPETKKVEIAPGSEGQEFKYNPNTHVMKYPFKVNEDIRIGAEDEVLMMYKANRNPEVRKSWTAMGTYGTPAEPSGSGAESH